VRKLVLIQRFRDFKRRISKQSVINFVGEHPRLVMALTGVGISILFSSTGRIFLPEAAAALNISIDHTSYVAPEAIKYATSDTHTALSCNCSCAECSPSDRLSDIISSVIPKDKFPIEHFPIDKIPK
jgi:hypothetical protein